METYYKCQVCWNEFDYLEISEKEESRKGFQLEICPYCGNRETLQELLTGKTAILQTITHFFGISPKFLEEENKHYFEKVFSEQVHLTLKLFTPLGPDDEEIHLDTLMLQTRDPSGYKLISHLTKVGKIVYIDLIQDSVAQAPFLVFKLEKQSWETVMVLRLELYPNGSFFVHFE